MKKANLFLGYLDNFLNVYIIEVKGLSPNTQRSYKFAFQLLLEFLYEKKNISSDKVTFELLSHDIIVEFLDWL